MLSHRMTRFRVRGLLALLLIVFSAAGVAACGEKGVTLASNDTASQRAADDAGVTIFTERCSGCHTLGAAGTEGSATNIRTREYKDGPNFNQRKETYECILYAIRNGGFSSGPMPQDIATGKQAEQVARFVAKYSGSQAKRPASPGSASVPDCPAG